MRKVYSRLQYTSLLTVLGVLMGVLGWAVWGSSPTEELKKTKADDTRMSVRSGDAAFAPSLQGTQVDGRIGTSEQQLILSPELLHLFDYYLSTLGQRQLPEISAQVKQELSRQLQLKPLALSQALGLFESYLAYKRALLLAPALNSQAGKTQSDLMQQRQQFLRLTQRQFFTDEVILALFAEDRVRNDDAIQRMRVFEDASLNLAQKQQRYEELDKAMPATLRAEKNAPVYIQQIEEKVAQLRESGVNEQAIYEFRALSFSADAAARLSELEREEKQWQQRIANYRELALQIVHPAGIATETLSPQQQQQLSQLREQRFKVQERPRLQAYENW